MVKVVDNSYSGDKDAEKREAEIGQLEQAVLMRKLSPDDVSVAGRATLQTALHREFNLQAQKRKNEALLLFLEAEREFLNRLNATIEETETRIKVLSHDYAEARCLSDHAFERMHRAEDLLKAIDDGVSDQEREQLVSLVGSDVQNASPDKLRALLNQCVEQERCEGLEQSDLANDLTERIADEQKRLDELKKQRDAYLNATTPEERQAIEKQSNSIISSDLKEDPTMPESEGYEVKKWDFKIQHF